MTLADMVPNSQCRITDTADEHLDLQSRLYALGLYPGALVRVLRSAPFGDPIQIKVGSTLLSIRRQEALFVRVEAA